MWNLILICLEKVQVSVPDRCKVYAKHTKGSAIVLDIADVLLGVKSQLEARFSPFGDRANLDAR
jgi:hypothetical protein